MTDKPSEEFRKFDKAMGKIMSVSKAELDRRLAEATTENLFIVLTPPVMPL
jgi:hypothetical protein